MNLPTSMRYFIQRSDVSNLKYCFKESHDCPDGSGLLSGDEQPQIFSNEKLK